jgi:hypothetical protein
MKQIGAPRRSLSKPYARNLSQSLIVELLTAESNSNAPRRRRPYSLTEFRVASA